jgi:pimeloyl-ACP methyl ester carboxylesterase
MTRYPVGTVSVDDVTLAYSEIGSGYPIVFISGLGATMDTWNPPVLERLAEQYRVVIFDHRDTGFSGSSGRPLSIPLLARDAAVLIDALGISSACLLGHSMGASIAQELALGRPEKVTGLVLVSGECGGAESVRMPGDVLARLLDKTGTMEEVIGRMVSLLFPESWLAGHDPSRYCPEVYEPPVKDEVLAAQAEAFFSWSGSFSRLEDFRVPTLVVTGTDDRIVPPVNSRIIHQLIPGSTLVEIPRGGHGVMYQYSDLFCENVLAFLDLLPKRLPP